MAINKDICWARIKELSEKIRENDIKILDTFRAKDPEEIAATESLRIVYGEIIQAYALILAENCLALYEERNNK